MKAPYSDSLISPFEDFCQGSNDPSSYLVALNVSAAKVKVGFSHPGSSMLDGICAFDLAEIERMNLGQLNLIKVSSFCGPQGVIWGYDTARPAALRNLSLFDLEHHGAQVPVYDGEPMIAAAAELFGTIKSKRFPIMPGSHTKAAYKSIVEQGPKTLYAACGVGIPEDREHCAATLMEDVGTITHEMTGQEKNDWKLRIARAVAESVLTVFHNQQTRCKEIFVLFTSIEVDAGEFGCAMSVAPYLTLAKKAVPQGDISRLKDMTLDEWRKATT